jgi:hypothetical protein
VEKTNIRGTERLSVTHRRNIRGRRIVTRSRAKVKIEESAVEAYGLLVLKPLGSLYRYGGRRRKLDFDFRFVHRGLASRRRFRTSTW